MTKKQLLNCIVAVCVFTAASSMLAQDAQEEIRAEVVEGIGKREASYVNLEFVFDVISNTYPDKELKSIYHKETRKMVQRYKEMSPPVNAISSANWRLWEVFVPELREDAPVYFVGFDGQQSRCYIYNEMEIHLHNDNGTVQPYDSFTNYSANLILSFLFTGMDGYLSNQDIVGVLPARSETIEGKKVYVFESGKTIKRIDTVSAADSDYIILKRELYDSRSRPLLTISTKTIGDYDGIKYPKTGTFTQFESGMQEAANYDFEITAVNKLAETDRTHWFPDWPKGTAVSDHINNKVTVIPNDMQKLERQILEQRSEFRFENSSLKRRWVIMFVNIVGVAVILFLFYRKRKKIFD